MTRAGMARTRPPYTWPPLRAYNVLADRVPRLARSLGTVPELHAEALAAAGPAPGAFPEGSEVFGSEAFGSEAFGDPSYLAGLEVFRAALSGEADLSPAGRFFARGAIVSALTNRVLVQRELAEDPGLLRRPVGPAMVVLGLPRSGTTLLQHLLSLDPANRSLRQWEANRPAPAPVVGAESSDPRVQAAERATRVLDRIAPAARTLHPTGPRLPCECVTLFANSFASLEFSAIYQVPSYTSWCLGTDMRPHYAYYVTQLQVLGRHDHRDRWALKSPAHLFWMDELAQALPEATLIQLHRDPTQVLGSYCSLAAVLAATNARHVDRAAIGGFWVRTWVEGVRRARQARLTLPAARVHDVRYTELVADPVGCVARIYDACGIPFSGRFEAAIRSYLDGEGRHGTGRHGYSLEDFGLDPRQVLAQFEEAGHVLWQ